MRSLALSFVLLAAAPCGSACAQTAPPSAAASPAIDAPTIKELAAAEQRLVDAIHKRDSAALSLLLSAEYVSSTEGSEWAIGKRGTLVRCGAGKLPAYVFDRDRQFHRDRQAIVLEGNARAVLLLENDITNPNERLRVRQWWIKQEGHWVLAAQVLPRRESEAEHEAAE